MPDINGKTLLVGLLATPIRHSNSPRMQSEAFAMTGVNCVQLAFEVGNEQLEDAVKGASRPRRGGLQRVDAQ